MLPIVNSLWLCSLLFKVKSSYSLPVHGLGKQLQLMWITLIEKNVSAASETACFRRKEMDRQFIQSLDLPIPRCVILDQDLELGTYLCTVGIVIPAYSSPGAIIRANCGHR